MSKIVQELEAELRKTYARRILVIDGPSSPTQWLSRALPPDGMAIVMESDTGQASAIRQELRGSDLADRVSIIPGPTMRMLHKIFGPFDAVVLGSRRSPSIPHERLFELLAEGGTLMTATEPDTLVVSEKSK
jgi:predicted O-methyltransferase YrrM